MPVQHVIQAGPIRLSRRVVGHVLVTLNVQSMGSVV